MNRTTLICLLGVGAALTGAGPAEAAVTGNYNASVHRLSVHMSASGDVARLSVDGGAILLNGAPIPGGPTVTNTGMISLEDDPRVDATAVLDLRGGPFAPGHGIESRPEPEIEVDQSFGDGLDTLRVVLPAGGGGIALGSGGSANNGAINLNAGEAAPADSDVPELSDVERVIVEGGEGADVVSGAGGPGTGENPGTSAGPILGPVEILGGGGADTVTGGSGADRIDVRDGAVDGVTCGAGADVVAADDEDTLAADCESRTSNEPPRGGGPGPGGPGGSPGDPAQATPRVTLVGRSARVRRGRATVALACSHATCAGRVVMRRIGSARYTAAPGTRVKVRVRLNRAGRKARRVRVRVTVAGGTPVTRKLRIKRGRARATAAASRAGSIVYLKRGDIWLAGPDGRKRRRVTRGGGYESPSQDDRGRIYAVRGGRFVRLTRGGRMIGRPFAANVGRSGNVSAFGPWDAQVSPDGRRIAYWRGVQRVGAPVGGVAPYRLENQVVISRSDRFTPDSEFGYQRDYRDPAWVSDRELLVFNYGLGVAQAAFFAPRPAGEPTFGQWFSELQIAQIGDGELSRDTRNLVVLAGNDLGLVNIVLYRRADDSPPNPPVRVCTFHSPDGSTHYAGPTFSPAGDAIAWAQDAPGRRADGVWVMPLGPVDERGNCAGRPRLLARGALHPDWGPHGA